MIDFTKKIHQSDKFRQPALTYIRTGQYCQYPKGTSEYMSYWTTEQDRCINGYTADDGDFISGYNYFYLNYCPILRIVNKEVNGKVKPVSEVTFPDFWDYDYYYFQTIEQAQEEGKHLCVLKSRRKGYSYKAASMLCRNYYLIPNSSSYVYASNKQYLTDDGVLTKAWNYMDFIDEHTAWGKKRSVKTQLRRRAGMWVKDEYDNQIEVGYKSEIIGVTLKDNPDVVRGRRANLILFEEAGSFKELSAAWQIARPSVEIDGKAFGTMIAYGTGGDEESNFFTLKDMFYHPEGYNCLALPNIWDENVANTECGFFIPQYANMDLRDEQGKRLYMDEDGNTLTIPARQYILEERRKVIENSTNSVAVDRYVAERPITPAEACLEFNGNIFPKKELQEQLGKIRTNKLLSNHKQVGDLIWESDGSLKWLLKKNGDITHYPLNKNDDPTGSIVIWEHPVKDAPIGLYIIGVDPYDHDQSGTNSLGSCFVYKRFQNFENYYDLIVAEYTGRPSTAEEFYENVRKLAIYYNARIMYENQNKGLFPYFVAKHCDYLLADQPDILNDIIGNSKVNRKKGCHMNKQIKQWGEGLIKDWLNDEKAPGHKNLHDILSEPLLEELISYNDLGNFDRCLTKDTLITTAAGFKKVQNIKIGDKVLTHTGKLKPVTWIDKHIHNGFKAKLRLVGDYRTLECTDNHPILVAFTDKVKHKYRVKALDNIQYLRADQLTYKYQFGLLPKRKLTEQIDLNDDILYVLGWIMSDGYIPKTSFGVKITFQGNQLEEAKRCLTIIEDYLRDEDYYIDNNHRRLKRKPTRIESFKNGVFKHEVIVHSRKLHDLALWFGCEANNKHINDEVYNKYSNLMPFIIGWLEGDGHQRLNINYDGYTRNGIELSTIYEKLIHQCRQILLDNGIYSSIRKVPSRKKNNQVQYSILISNEYINKLLDFYPSSKYSKITINRNTSKVLETKDGFWVPIKLLGLERINEEVYNFEVQDDHTYIANGTTTHNCMALIQVMIYREQLYNVVVKEKKKQNKSRLLFDGPIFNEDSWYDDTMNNVEEDVYTFN